MDASDNRSHIYSKSPTRKEEGMSFLELAQHLGATARRPVVHAKGAAGEVYLCHPFLILAARSHHGRAPRFIARQSLEPAGELRIHRPDPVYSPVEKANRLSLGIE
jgi:hypothetical protein